MGTASLLSWNKKLRNRGVCTCKLERRERELWEVGGDSAEGRRPARPQLWNSETEKEGDTKLIAKPEAVPRVKHLWIFMC